MSRDDLVQLRLPRETKRLWAEYAAFRSVSLSQMVRDAVAEHADANWWEDENASLPGPRQSKPQEP